MMVAVLSVEQSWSVRRVDEWHLVSDTYDGVLEQDVRFDRRWPGRRIVSLEDGSRVDPGVNPVCMPLAEWQAGFARIVCADGMIVSMSDDMVGVGHVWPWRVQALNGTMLVLFESDVQRVIMPS